MLTKPKGGLVFEQCGIMKADGTKCRAPKKKGYDFCRKHNGETILAPAVVEADSGSKSVKQMRAEALAILPSLGIQTMGELYESLADLINQTRAGEVPTKQAQVLGTLYREAGKILSMREKYDPKQIAKREFTAETARDLARSISQAEARDILSHRSDKPLTELIERGPRTITIGDASDQPVTAKQIEQLFLEEMETDDSETEDEDDA